MDIKRRKCSDCGEEFLPYKDGEICNCGTGYLVAKAQRQRRQDRQRWAEEWKRDIHNAITAMGNLMPTFAEQLPAYENGCAYKLDKIAESDQPLPDLTKDWREE